MPSVSAPFRPDPTNAGNPSMPVTALTEADFDQATAQGVCVLDFWAPWCGPCRMQGPIFESVAAEFEKSGRPVRFYKVNVDEEPMLAQQFGIMSIPTLILFKGGEVANQSVGVISEADIKAFVEQAL